MGLFSGLTSPFGILSNSLLASALVGSLLPCVGVLLLQRQMIWYGFVLPQIAALGVAMTHLLFDDSNGGGQAHFVVEFFGGFTALLLFFGIVAFIGVRRLSESSLAALSVCAGSASLLLFALDPHFESGVLMSLRGELLTVSDPQLYWLTGVWVVIAICLGVWGKLLLQLGIDREQLLVSGRSVRKIEVLFLGVTSSAVTVAYLTVGPILLFSALVLPVVLSGQICTTLKGFLPVAVLIGLIGSVGGYLAAYQLDLPPSPTQTMILVGVGVFFYLASQVQLFVRRVR